MVGRWEKLYLNPFPTQKELEALADVVMVDADRLAQMLPPKGVTMQPRPILLCAVCYAENPYHRIEWQFKERWGCDRHQLPLLGKCINCETPFPIPAYGCKGNVRIVFCRLRRWRNDRSPVELGFAYVTFFESSVPVAKMLDAMSITEIYILTNLCPKNFGKQDTLHRRVETVCSTM